MTTYNININKLVLTFNKFLYYNTFYRINVQNTKDKNKIFPPLLIIEYADLIYEQIDKIVEITLEYKIKFIIKDNNIDSYFMVKIQNNKE